MKAIIISRKQKKEEIFGDPQVAPFTYYRKELKKKYGLEIKNVKVDYLHEVKEAEVSKYDVVLLQLKINKKKQDELKDFLRRIKAKKVILDNRDSTGGIAFELFNEVDVYVKNQLLNNLEEYQKRHIDNRYHVERITGKKEGKRRVLPNQFSKKLILGWNLGTSQKLIEELEKRRPSQREERPIDICLRGGLKGGDKKKWYLKHRRNALKKIKKLRKKYAVLSEGAEVSRTQYLRELRQAKIAVSPLGLGEICIRDFESIIQGALLFKPSVGHLKTVPNIFRPYETYVPLAYDFSDLREKADYYLNYDKEREKIVDNARRAYKEYFEKKVFVTQVGLLLQKLGYNVEVTQEASFL